HDKADKNRIDIHLMLVRRTSTAEAASIRELRIDGGVECNDVARGTVCDRDRAAEVDGIDNIEARSLVGGHRRRRDAERFINAERLCVPDQDREKNVRAKTR